MNIASKVPCLEMSVFGSFLFWEQDAHLIGIYRIVSENLYVAYIILPKKPSYLHIILSTRYVKRPRQ